MGAPKKPASKKLTSIVILRVTSAEKALYKKAAKKLGLKLTAWFRGLSRDAVGLNPATLKAKAA